MNRTPNGFRRSAAALLAFVLGCGGSTALAAEMALIGKRPAKVMQRPSRRGPALVVLPPGTHVEVLDRQDGWCWVLVPTNTSDGRVRPGWVRKDLLVPDGAPGTAGAPVIDGATGGADPGTVAARASTTPATIASGAVPADRQQPAASGPSADPPDHPSVIAAAPAAAPVSPLASAANAARSASAAARRPGATGASGGSAAAPPAPVGSEPSRGWSPGNWFQPRALRGSVGFGYQSATVSQATGNLDERRMGGLATISTAFAVLDPKILTVDFSGEFQLGRTKSGSAAGLFNDKTGLGSYRVELGVLTGRSAPLHVYADRVSSANTFQPLGDSLDSLRHTRGARSTNGFTWDVAAPHVPRIQLSASTGLQSDQRDYLFGYSSTNRERRAELRINGDRPGARFDLDFNHGEFVYDVPAAGMRSSTGSDLLLVGGQLSPSKRLILDMHARASRFQLGNGVTGSSVTGVGGDGSVLFQVSRNVAATGRYSYSSNTFEAVLSGAVDPRQTGAASASPSVVAKPTTFSDGEVRLERSTHALTTAVIVKSVSFGVPGFLPPTLTALTTAGGLVRAERAVKAFTLSASAEGSAGTARSNLGAREPYRELGVQAGVASNAGTLFRFGFDANVRRTGRLDFYPVNLESRFVTAHVETRRPSWAVIHASVTHFDTLRDIVYADNRDRHTGFMLALSSRWYEASVDVGQSDTNPLLLSSSVLGSRPDVLTLLVSRPDVVRNLLVSTDRSRSFNLQLRPIAGLTIQGRVRRMEQAYPDLFGFRIRGEQLLATYQLRQVQLEVGVERFDSLTSFGDIRDRRLYFRVRRDLLFMR
jgi:hypothetical protein